MASSGISVPSEILEAFKNLKLHRKHKYIVITFKNTQMECKMSPANATFEKFKNDLPLDEAGYGIYDSDTKKKLVLIHWNPDHAPTKNKMIVSTSLKALQDSLEGIGTSIQITNHSELDSVCQ